MRWRNYGRKEGRDFFTDILSRAKNGELERMGIDGIIKRMEAIEEYIKAGSFVSISTEENGRRHMINGACFRRQR